MIGTGGSFTFPQFYAPVVLVNFRHFRTSAAAASRADAAQTALVYLSLLIALSLLAATLVYWTQAWFIAQPKPGAPATPVPGNTSPVGELFGVAQPQAPPAAALGPEIRLSGVIAASGGTRGYAIVQLDGNEILAIPEGGSIASGIRLAEVHPDHVVVERNDAREILVWPEKNVAAEAGPSLEGGASFQGAVPDPYE